MPIAGIVITLKDDQSQAASVLESLGREESLTLGDSNGSRLPAVIDAPTDGAFRACWDRLESLNGVDSVSLACALYADSADETGKEGPIEP